MPLYVLYYTYFGIRDGETRIYGIDDSLTHAKSRIDKIIERKEEVDEFEVVEDPSFLPIDGLIYAKIINDGNDGPFEGPVYGIIKVSTEDLNFRFMA